MSAQFPLDLPPHPIYAAEDFVVSDCNRAAYDLIMGWRDWPSRAAAVWGEAGAGKTHLAQVWRAATEATDMDAAGIAALDIAALDRPRRFALDLGGEALPAAAERPLFHLLNAVREHRGALLIVARSAPARWPVALRDLGSRLRALPSAEVGAPDDGLFAAVLGKLLSDRQLAVDRETLAYLARRSERSFAALQDLAARLDRAALARRQAITIPLARKVLADIAAEAQDG